MSIFHTTTLSRTKEELIQFLQDAFNGTVKGIDLPGMGFSVQELLDVTIYSSDIAQALWHVDDLDSLMDILADCMTDAFRNLYSDPASDADGLGKVYTTQKYVYVTWHRLILPVGLVLASCMVLLAAIISSSRHQTIVWKPSSLAVLFHGFARGAGGNQHSVYMKQMAMVAEEVEVWLAETADGEPRLVELKKRSNKAPSSRWRKWLRPEK